MLELILKTCFNSNGENCKIINEFFFFFLCCVYAIYIYIYAQGWCFKKTSNNRLVEKKRSNIFISNQRMSYNIYSYNNQFSSSWTTNVSLIFFFSDKLQKMCRNDLIDDINQTDLTIYLLITTKLISHFYNSIYIYK